MNKKFLQAPCWFHLNDLLSLGQKIMKQLLKVWETSKILEVGKVIPNSLMLIVSKFHDMFVKMETREL